MGYPYLLTTDVQREVKRTTAIKNNYLKVYCFEFHLDNALHNNIPIFNFLQSPAMINLAFHHIFKGLHVEKVDFYFDFLSPYSYFAWINHKSIQADFNYRPLAMGSLFSHFEMKGPGEILPKRIYMLKQCFKYAAKNNIEFTPPVSHPFNPLYALRLATKSISNSQKEIIDILFKAAWADGKDLSDTDFLENLLNQNNLDGKSLLDKTFHREVKLEVKQNYKDARDAMIFGVPTFKTQKDIFWGNDSISDLNDHLNGTEVDWNKDLFKSLLGLD